MFANRQQARDEPTGHQVLCKSASALLFPKCPIASVTRHMAATSRGLCIERDLSTWCQVCSYKLDNIRRADELQGSTQ